MSPKANAGTVERVFRHLAARYHPVIRKPATARSLILAWKHMTCFASRNGPEPTGVPAFNEPVGIPSSTPTETPALGEPVGVPAGTSHKL